MHFVVYVSASTPLNKVYVLIGLSALYLFVNRDAETIE